MDCRTARNTRASDTSVCWTVTAGHARTTVAHRSRRLSYVN